MNTPSHSNSIPPTNARPIARPAFDPLDPQWQGGKRVEDLGAQYQGETPVAPLSPEAMQKREQVGVQVIAARMAWARSDRATARTHLQNAFAIDSTDCAALELLGDIFLEEAEQEKALAVFERGLKYHPRHAIFEERIAQCYLDLDEMARDRERSMQLMSGDPGRWQDRKPGIALGLSFLIPGTGHFYNDDNEIGGLILGGWLFATIMWGWMLNSALSSLAGKQILINFGAAISSMGALQKGWFWLNLLAGIAIWLFAAHDAYQGAERANRARRRLYGV